MGNKKSTLCVYIYHTNNTTPMESFCDTSGIPYTDSYYHFDIPQKCTSSVEAMKNLTRNSFAAMFQEQDPTAMVQIKRHVDDRCQFRANIYTKLRSLTFVQPPPTMFDHHDIYQHSSVAVKGIRSVRVCKKPDAPQQTGIVKKAMSEGKELLRKGQKVMKTKGVETLTEIMNRPDVKEKLSNFAMNLLEENMGGNAGDDDD